jgi:hypothetical protein
MTGSLYVREKGAAVVWGALTGSTSATVIGLLEWRAQNVPEDRHFRMIKVDLTGLPIFMSFAVAGAVWDPALEADPREPAA